MTSQNAISECTSPTVAVRVRAGDLVEAATASNKPRTIRVRVDREPWPIGDNATTLCGEGGPVAVLTDSIRVVEPATTETQEAPMATITAQPYEYEDLLIDAVHANMQVRKLLVPDGAQNGKIRAYATVVRVEFAQAENTVHKLTDEAFEAAKYGGSRLDARVAVAKHIDKQIADAKPVPGAGEPAATDATATVDARFGGHEFEYESQTDLFRCTECRVYEVVARDGDGPIKPCPGLIGYGGDTERVYLLLTTNPELPDNYVTSLAWKIRETGIGRTPRFSWRGGKLLVESAPSVVAKLARWIEEMTLDFQGRQVPGVSSMEHLTAEAGQAVITENRAAYVAEYGE